MNESILNALMQLFAIIASINNEGISHNARYIVIDYLKKQLNKNLVDKYLHLYDNFISEHKQEQDKKKRRKKLSVSSVKVLKICSKINESLHQKEKFIVLIRLLEFINDDGIITDNENDFITTVADIFNISEIEFNNLKAFILKKIEDIPQKDNLVIIDNKTKDEIKEECFLKVKFLHDENLDERIIILYINTIETFIFAYLGKINLNITGRNIIPKKTYVFDSGSIIKGGTIQPIYQTFIASYFLSSPDKAKVQLHANRIRFQFPKSENGIQRFSFLIESGQLIGIMGGSGVGKSTLMNVLIGKYKLSKGNILINGYDIYEDKEQLEGLIGYIPQDDLLIEELTVYQNLYYNTKLCFGNYSKQEIDNAVEKILKELDLFEIKHLKVGSPLKKFISGGQRKRLNIALELIREPAILFVDEPTSGLSSMDSEIVMQLLKHQALSGKLIVINIHQPSSDIYKLFDRVWVMDKGGYPVYTGNPIDAISYFKELSHYADAEENECRTCGTVHPEQVLEIVETKMVNEFGKYTEERKMSPRELYTLYKVNLEKRSRFKIQENTEIPKTNFKIPNFFKQFKIFSIRDLLSKLANKQYLIINLFEAPALAFILAFFTKYITNSGEYIFWDNKNLPIFLFMSIVVALFMGLSVSAEEIIKDRKILEREKFLNLSKFSYINSKVLIMFLISAIQMFTFVVIGNLILEIRGMTFQFWLVLFTTAAAANMIGLNISSALNSVITIYIMIPLILVPQMLLGGAMMKFDDLHDSISKKKYVPVLADIMFSRWAYEALIVEQFKHNKYQQNFFEIEKEKSEAVYISSYLITELYTRLKKCEEGMKEEQYKELVEKYFNILRTEISQLKELPELANLKYEHLNKLNAEDFTDEIATDTYKFFEDVKTVFNARSNDINEMKDNKIMELEIKYCIEQKIFMQKYLNKKRKKKIILQSYRNKIIDKKIQELIDELNTNDKKLLQFYKEPLTEEVDKILFELIIEYESEQKLINQIENFANEKSVKKINRLVDKYGKEELLKLIVELQKYKTYYNRLGKQQLIDLKKKYHNEKLAEFVLDKTQSKQCYETDNMLIRKKDPIYMEPYSNYGRAHFYAPVKIIGNYHFDTFWFNVAFLWFSIFFLYLTLYFDVLKKILKFSGRINFKLKK